MWKITEDFKEYVSHLDIRNYPFTYEGRVVKNINGVQVSVKDNYWGHHLHIKVSNGCNAKCAFCVEHGSKIGDNAEKLLSNVDNMLTEMEREGILHTVSVTGGEPTIWPHFAALCEILKKHNIPFVTMNTNGVNLEKYIDIIDGLFDFVDISRHAIDDVENQRIFGVKNVPMLDDLKRIKSKLTKTKLRLQCVCCRDMTVEDFYKMVDTYKFADDMSFRRLMVLNDEYDVNYTKDSNHQDAYYEILDDVVKNHKFVNQTIQDFYVYEDWDVNGLIVDFSYSDMEKVREIEDHESDSIYREFICHPNGKITGSWNPNVKVIYD